MKRCNLLIFLLTTCSIACGQNKKDGNWYRSIDEHARVFFVAGYVAGQANASLVVTATICLDDGNDGDALLACVSRREETLRKRYYFGSGGTTVGQIKDGLDAFYADYRNRGIPVDGAMATVSMSINGVPAALVEKNTERLRQDAGAN